MTRRNLFNTIQAAVLNRLLFIVILLMIASLFSVLPIKSCTTPGGRAGSEAIETSALGPLVN